MSVYKKIDQELKQVAASPKQVEDAVKDKVDKVSGKGLSTNDFTNEDKQKLDGIASGAQVNPGAATQSSAGLMSASDKTKLDGISAGAQVNSVTGVKGNSESAYRTGNVNITPANIGLGNVNNTADANKSVSYASSAGSATSATSAAKATQDGNGNNIVNTYAKKSIYGDSTVSLNRKANTTIGSRSIAFGYNNEASATDSHAFGYQASARGDQSFACGVNTTAIGKYSHAEGSNTTASGKSSHAEGDQTIASGQSSHASGQGTESNNPNSCAFGHYNLLMLTGGSANNKSGHALVIGNGTSADARSNAFSIEFNGITRVANTITASTVADYAEYFEWDDGNINNEDRVGLFVTLEGEKIRIASESDDYILGIVSGQPFVLGNGDCGAWNGMYLRDEFNRLIMEPAPKIEYDEETRKERNVFDENGNLVYEGERPVLNPSYDNTKPYIPRLCRPEWSPVGMLGVLSVKQDGTLRVNGYCMCSENGIATACFLQGQGYRVIKIINERIAKVVL